MPQWITLDPSGLNRRSLEHAAKTSIASLVALLASRALHLPEFYWGGIATIVVLQSTLGAALSVSVLRLTGDALGAFAGAVLAICFGHSVYIFAVGVFLLGLLTAAAHLDRSAFRFSGIALAVVMLIPRSESPWIVAWHRFSEIAVGIVIALLVVLVWPERTSSPVSAASPGGSGKP